MFILKLILGLIINMLARVPIGTLALRILVEKQFLRRELQGYDTYTQRVRHKLIPFLW